MELTEDERALRDRLDRSMPDDGVARYYDKLGAPITFGTWGVLKSREGYLRVGSTPVSDMWVSTVWLGLDHAFWPGGRPIIFETAIFALTLDWTGVAFDMGHTLYMARHPSLDLAEAGHQEAVYAAMRAGLAARLEDYVDNGYR